MPTEGGNHPWYQCLHRTPGQVMEHRDLTLELLSPSVRRRDLEDESFPTVRGDSEVAVGKSDQGIDAAVNPPCFNGEFADPGGA